MTKKRWMQIIGFVILVVLLIGGYYAYTMYSFAKNIGNNKMFSISNTPLKAATWNGTEPVNILIMGVDRRSATDIPRSDSILMASINPTTKKVTLFSIMRDSYVDIPGYQKAKINAAFADGGPELEMQTVAQYLDIPIHYYVVTDFTGFSKIVDTVGGVDVNVPYDMVHPDVGMLNIDLKKGYQHLDGLHALMFVRFRGTPRADFDRTARQRQMLQLVEAKMKQPQNLVKLPTLLKEIEPYTQVSSNFTPDAMMKLMALIFEGKGSPMETVQVPPDNALQESWDPAGEEVLVPDIPAVRQFVKGKIGADDSQTSQLNQTQGDSSKGPSGQGQQTQGQQGQSDQNGNSQGTGTGNDGNSTSNNGGGQTAINNGQTVNIRQKPGTQYDIIGHIDSGGVVTILEQDGDWDYVKTSDGMYGYVLGSLLTPQ